jgi:hypothetical protein
MAVSEAKPPPGCRSGLKYLLEAMGVVIEI